MSGLRFGLRSLGAWAAPSQSFQVRLVLVLVQLSAMLLSPLPAAKPASAVGLGFALGIGSGQFDVGGSVEVDSAGNVYVAGSFQGTVDFDRTAVRNDDVLTSKLDQFSQPSNDAFVAKYSPAGSLIWVRSFGGPGDDYAGGIVLDSTGNIYVTGSFRDTADFDPSSNAFNLTSNGNTDAFVMKLDPSGSLAWARAAGGPFDDYASALVIGTVNSSTQVFVTGAFREGAAVDFDRTAVSAGDTLTSLGYYDGFLLNLTAATGAFTWVRQMGGTGLQSPTDISLGVSGVYVTGYFTETTFSGGQTINSAGGIDAFVALFSPSGTLFWAKAVGGPGTDRAFSIAADTFGHVYVTGVFEGTADFDPGAGIHNVTVSNESAYILQLDALTNGTFVSVKVFSASTSSGVVQGNSIRLDRSNTGALYLAGYFGGTVDFDPGTGTTSVTSSGGTDTFLVKLNPDGSFVYVRTFGSNNSNIVPNGSGLLAPGNGSVYLAGNMYGTAPVDFDPGPGTANITSAGSQDIILVRLVEDAPTNTIPSGTHLVAQGSSGTFSAGTFNKISVSAPDAGNNLRVLVAGVSNGAITLATTAGLTFQAGDGSNDVTMTFTGTQAAVNAALDGLRYTPSPSYTGPAGIQIRSGIASGPTGSVQNTFSMVSITVEAGTCSPRPRVQLQSTVTGGHLQVTVTSTPQTGGPNPFAGIIFGTIQNGAVSLNGQPMANGQAVPFAANTSQAVFTVQRPTAGQAVTVPFTVVDICGPWQTFVGAGAAVGGF
ncbi:MAG: SBBP repeat-containing protein [Chloroflexota bacterium]